MRDRLPLAGTCVVQIALPTGTVCEIVTTASHAIQICAGETVLPANLVSVRNREGHKLSMRSLRSLAKAEVDD